MPEGTKFDLWFDTLAEESEIRKDGSKMSGQTFLERVDNFATKSSVRYEPRAALETAEKISSVRQRLQGLYEEDPSFRQSVANMIRSERVLIKAHKESVVGECTSGACRSTRLSPRQVHFDGTQTLTFQKDSEGSLSYKTGEDGLVIAMPHAFECDTADCLALPKITGQQLKPGSDEVADRYRIVFPDETSFVVTNQATGSDPLTCAKRLCTLNRDQCPAPHCQKSGSACVPVVEHVASVTL